MEISGRGINWSFDFKVLGNEMKVNIVVDGVNVEGIITLINKWDINVKITAPYKNKSRGRHIAYFARTHISYMKDEKISEDGLKTARGLLKELYMIFNT